MKTSVQERAGRAGSRWGSAAGGQGTSGASRMRAGFSLIELLISFSLIVVVLFSFTRVTLTSRVAARTNHEARVAKEAARGMLELVQTVDFETAFQRYNADGSDDPDGPNTAPGAGFAVDGLPPVDGDADGLAGEVVFPTLAGAPTVLREDLLLPSLGLPADLSGDGQIDALDHSGDYLVLPVLVRVEWQSRTGPAKVEFKTLIANYQ